MLCVLTGTAQYVLWLRSRNENPGMTQTSNPGSENIYRSASVFLSEKWAFWHYSSLSPLQWAKYLACIHFTENQKADEAGSLYTRVYKKLCLLVLQSSRQIVPYCPHWKQDSCGQHGPRPGAQGMFALPNWIHKILKGYSYYSILSNPINEDLRASSSTNTPKSWSINTKLHCQSTYFFCPRGAEKGGRRLFPQGNPGKALVASGLSQLCPQMGAGAS